MGHSSIGYGVPSFRVWCSSACMFFPVNSAGSSYPRMRAADGFEKRQVPSESQPQIASEAESSIRRIRSSLSRRMSSASIRFELSSESDIGEYGSSGLGQETQSLAEIRLVDYASAKHLGYHYIG